MSRHVDAGNPTWVLCKQQQVPFTAEIILALVTLIDTEDSLVVTPPPDHDIAVKTDQGGCALRNQQSPTYKRKSFWRWTVG